MNGLHEITQNISIYKNEVEEKLSIYHLPSKNLLFRDIDKSSRNLYVLLIIMLNLILHFTLIISYLHILASSIIAHGT